MVSANGCTDLFKFLCLPSIKFQIGQSPGAGLNRRPRPYQGRALPTELPGHISRWLIASGSIATIGMLSGHLFAAITAISKLERETGLEPATPSLEGSRSTN